ncbi:MAG TPA: Gfo/Idh/MocA family oxidoreductase [Firmicutes bacterium]|nr:Gfo/Idh/MocA family oxidoreductase [Bacillota bacterium]
MRLIQVGVRRMGNHWVKVGLNNADAEMVGYVDILPEHLDLLSREHGISKDICYTDLQTALNEQRPDGVIIVTPPQFHAEQIIMALEAGCHVLTEKPLADTWDNCRQVAEAAKKTGRVVMVAQNYRYSPVAQSLYHYIQQGKIGVPGEVTLRFFRGPHFGGFREEMPYPLIIDMSIHHYDLMRYLLQIEPVAITGRSWNPPWSWFRGDASSMVFIEAALKRDPARRVYITYTASWCSKGGTTPWNGEWLIFGDEGCLKLENDHLYIKADDQQPWEELPIQPMERTGQDYLLHEFISAVKQGCQPETNCFDNIKSIEMVFKTVESFETGRRVLLAGE